MYLCTFRSTDSGPHPFITTTPPVTPDRNPHREMNEHNIEIGIIGADRKFRILSPSEVRDYLDEAN